MTNPNDAYPVREVIARATFERIQIAVRKCLSDANLHFVANHLSGDFRDDLFIRGIVADFRSFLLAGSRKEVGRETVRVPADWWEAVKERWFPAWAARRWPVHYREIVTVRLEQRVCPHVNLVTSEDRLCFQWLTGRDWE